MAEQLEHLLSLGNVTGEGPLWHPDEQRLYWLDIPPGRFFRFDPATGQHEMFEAGLPIGTVGLRADGDLIMATKRGFANWDWETNQLDPRVDVLADHPEMRFNDGKIDAQGRFWAGSMLQNPDNDTTGAGHLYRLDADDRVQIMESNLIISNGLGWSPDGLTFYLTDSPRRIIWAYDFEPESGTLANRRPFIDSQNEPGVPDGMTVDSEGYIWSARWGGWRITRYDPNGKVERVVEMPVECPSCCAFGGRDLNELYITSATSGVSEATRARQPWAGDLFRLKLDIKGRLEPRFAD